jgi:poly-gamma-glutamate synthesis protein (capsule biosynthesis protein)
MFKIVMVFILLTLNIWAVEASSISAINSLVKQQMIKSKSYKTTCPVPLKNLRYLRLKYVDFKGKTMMGEMIVHKDVAVEVVTIFNALYSINYPIHKMKLVSAYKANDWQSIEADNTSAFNCRNATGSKKWSKHSYGKAIDINPIENPYISRKGRISHRASQKHRRREHALDVRPENRALLLKNDQATKIFKKYGWKWGGDWSGVKDYQHFSK